MNVIVIIAMLLSYVNAQFQGQSCSISCPGNPTMSSLQAEHPNAGRPGKRGDVGPPGPPGAPGRRGQKGEQGESPDNGILENEIDVLRNSITKLKRFALGGWTGASNGRWYRLFHTPKNFNEARALCKMYGTSLAHIGMKSSALISELIPQLGFENGEHAWVGVTDVAQEGTWVWEDGSTDPVVNWNTVEPNGGASENCGEIQSNLKLNDYPCGIDLSVLCETEQM